MESFLSFFGQYGEPGLFVAGGILLFHRLLTRHDSLAHQNLQELKAQLAMMTRRAMRAELFLRAYARAGIPLPEEEVQTELDLAGKLVDVFPEYRHHNDQE